MNFHTRCHRHIAARMVGAQCIVVLHPTGRRERYGVQIVNRRQWMLYKYCTLTGVCPPLWPDPSSGEFRSGSGVSPNHSSSARASGDRAELDSLAEARHGHALLNNFRPRGVGQLQCG
jgi:hypothetical protein